MSPSPLAALLETHHDALLTSWRGALPPGDPARDDAAGSGTCATFLRLLRRGLAAGSADGGADLAPLREMLAELSRQRGREGSTPSATAGVIFALKRPLFARLQAMHGADAKAMFAGIVEASELLDRLALYTTEVFQGGREKVISQQATEMLELSTPVVVLWDGILALPIIGTLDSNRTQVVMETLLERIVERSAQVAIIDITGVPTVDTLVAQHLMRTVSAAQLMGVECIISGIRPHIAQTIVHLGVNLGGIATVATLAAAFKLALRRLDGGDAALRQLSGAGA